MTRNRIIEQGDFQLVTLDARQAHPGFDPFAASKARRAAELELAGRMKTMDRKEWAAAAVAFALGEARRKGVGHVE